MTATPVATPLLTATDVTIERGGRGLVSGLSLQVMPGEIWQVEGVNGSGKTSLLRVLSGLSRYGYDGQVERAVPLLYLGHRSAVKPLLSPLENLRLHPGGEGDHTDSDIERALAAVGLAGFEDNLAGTLSAGQQRRINLARLYLSPCPLWILDEPFTAIDREGVLALEQRFAQHAQAGGAIVCTSHQPLNVQASVSRLSLDRERAA
ncbi:MAG: cytochrome c biogenesis heme-transporting ATPase CcmA [Gammaproteobacteria bacterium]|nr:cytochrome c biogenesis heme-transporting ATPase CcmA [Gammaproteobacteria bacterium]